MLACKPVLQSSWRPAAAGATRAPFRQGFTLVEILAVVVILGIASAIMIPQMGTRDDMRAAAAARTLVSDLIYAQNLAISTGKYVYVKFDVANNSYTLLSTAAPSGGDVPLVHPLTQGAYVQQFGASARGWELMTIQSAVFNGIDTDFRPEFTVAFDEIGSPWVYCYDENEKNEMLNGEVVVKCGIFTKRITIQQATGEIQCVDGAL